jgi:hypothetical protein
LDSSGDFLNATTGLMGPFSLPVANSILGEKENKKHGKVFILFLSLHQHFVFFPSPLIPPNQQANLEKSNYPDQLL